MTTHAGNTPKFGVNGQKLGPDDKFIESRVIGVEVVCGPVDTHFVYITDDTIAHGANIMIEVQRQGSIIVILHSYCSFPSKTPYFT